MKYIILLNIFFLFLACESAEKKRYRTASDPNIYETFTLNSGTSFHIDSKCKKIEESSWFQPISKKSLSLNFDDRLMHRNTYIVFCPSCTNLRDIEKLKSQIANLSDYRSKINYSYNLYTKLIDLDPGFTRTYSEFLHDMKNEDNRKRIYFNLKNKYTHIEIPKSYNEFSTQMGF